MDTYFLPGVARYLATRAQLEITTTTGVVAAVVLLALFPAGEMSRSLLSGDPPRRDESLRRFAVPMIPLLLAVSVVVIERFFLLAV